MSPCPFCEGSSLLGGGGWNALQYGDVMTYSACVFIAPNMRLFIAGSFFVRGWYCASWFVESRSHSALISPVTIKLCGPSHFPLLYFFLVSVPSICHRTVVSSVLGKAFSNSLAKSLSIIRDVNSCITSSTSGDSNVRHAFEGR